MIAEIGEVAGSEFRAIDSEKALISILNIGSKS
jgi:hypothetical protein